MEISSPTDTNITYFDTTDSEDHKNSDNESHEFSYNPSQGIQVPEPNDIVCGRGKFTVDHPGNRRFRRLIWGKKDDYQKATRRDDKTKITHELVRKLRSGTDAGRFLLYDPKTKLWYDTGDEYARVSCIVPDKKYNLFLFYLIFMHYILFRKRFPIH